MAVAALQILGLTDQIAEILPVEPFVPSPGQGCVAIECVATNGSPSCWLVSTTPRRAAVERRTSVLAELGTGCSLPVGAYVENVGHGDGTDRLSRGPT